MTHKASRSGHWCELMRELFMVYVVALVIIVCWWWVVKAQNDLELRWCSFIVHWQVADWMVVGWKFGRMATKYCAIGCRCWFESWDSIAIAIAPIFIAMLAVWTLSVLITTSTHLSVLSLIVGTIMKKFWLNFSSQACIVQLKLLLVSGGLVSGWWVELCIAWHVCAIAFWVGAWANRWSFFFSSNLSMLLSGVRSWHAYLRYRHICSTTQSRWWRWNIVYWHHPACLCTLCAWRCVWSSL